MTRMDSFLKIFPGSEDLFPATDRQADQNAESMGYGAYRLYSLQTRYLSP
jgi:hypothetical protein